MPAPAWLALDAEDGDPAAFLRHTLARERPDLVPTLHLRAAEAHPDPGQAVAHLLTAGAWKRAADRIEALGEALLAGGLLSRLGGWIGALPPEMRDGRPSLLLLLGRCAWHRGALAEALPLLERAARAFAQSGAAHLAAHQWCVISTRGRAGVAALAVAYRAVGLELECLPPRWSEPAHALEDNPQVAVVIVPDGAEGRGWLHLVGRATPISTPDWPSLPATGSAMVDPADLYVVARVRPQRLDLLDERLGWGARTTLELE